MDLRRSPLHERHVDLGARRAAFGGWEMPLQYEGVLAEHAACREAAAVFDVSHLGSVAVEGEGALAALQWAFTNDLERVAPGRAQYTHLLDPRDAHVVDDLIVWWVAPERFVVMPNASNTEPLVTALRTAVDRGGPARGEDLTPTRAVLAVQGPQAGERLDAIAPEFAVGRFAVAAASRNDTPCLVAGTGYTGELGVEIHVPATAATELFDALLGAGVTPAGLGARDTLRLEMGYPLHGHELGPGITPDDAGLSWVVRMDKGDFLGREALVAARERGATRELRGLVAESRQVPRAECAVIVDGEPAGVVTSGNFSPTLGRGIALAFVPTGLAEGTKVDVDVRGRALAAEIVNPPFVRR
jgi:aminomethyltransferase